LELFFIIWQIDIALLELIIRKVMQTCMGNWFKASAARHLFPTVP
jgi:hypothetical protein